ncbi:MAG: hypothetical protein ACFB8W_24415 [Elainellaceae cyanobacterium]
MNDELREQPDQTPEKSTKQKVSGEVGGDRSPTYQERGPVEESAKEVADKAEVSKTGPEVEKKSKGEIGGDRSPTYQERDLVE